MDEDLESQQASTKIKKKRSSNKKDERKKKRRLTRRTQRISENPSLAQTVSLIFKRYDADENGHLDEVELQSMILDLQRSVEDHVKVSADSARDAANLLINALDRDNNNEVELAELQDWIIRKSDKLDENTRRRIMAMHDAGDQSENVERQVVLVRLLNAVEDISDCIEKGCIVAVFGTGRLGLAITDTGSVTKTFVAPTPKQKQRAPCLLSGDIVAGMEIIKVGHKSIQHAEEIIEILKSSPRPIQIIFQNATDHKQEAARKLQRIQSNRQPIDEAKLRVMEMRVHRVSEDYFNKYDQDGNGALDAEELKHLLLDIIVSWTGVEDEKGDVDDISDKDMDKEIQLAYHGAHLLVEKEGTTDGTEENSTKCVIKDGPLGMKIACIDIHEGDDPDDTAIPHSTEVHVTEVAEGSQADVQRIKEGYIITKINDITIKGKEYLEVVNMFKTIPRPFPLELLRGQAGNPVLSKNQFNDWVWKTSQKWKKPTPKMIKAKGFNHIGAFLIEIAIGIAATAEAIKGGRQVVALFRTPAGGEVGLELSEDGRVINVSNGEAMDLGVEQGMILIKVGKRDMQNKNDNVNESFMKLLETAARPLRVVFRRRTSEENNAARKMQAVHRGKTVRKDMEQKQELNNQHQAATKMQALHRGKTTRNNNIQETRQRDQAAIKVQSHVRRKNSMKEVHEERRSVLCEKLVELVLVHTDGGSTGRNKKQLNCLPKYKRTLEERVNQLTDLLALWYEYCESNSYSNRKNNAGSPPLYSFSIAIIQVAPIWGNDTGKLRQDLCVRMATGEPNFFGNSYDKLIFLQKWTRSTLLHHKFQRIVREAAAIKIQNLLSRNKDYKQGKVVLANKKKERNELEIQQASNASKKRNQQREQSRQTRSREAERLDQKRREREQRRRQRNGSNNGGNNEQGLNGTYDNTGTLSPPGTMLPSILPRPLTPNTPNNPERTTMNDFLLQLRIGPQRAVQSLLESRLFLKPSVNDLLPLLKIAPAHQQAVIRRVVQIANNGDTSSLEDLILDGCDEAIEAPIPTQYTNNGGYGNTQSGSYDQWGSGDSYNMQGQGGGQQQMVPFGGGYHQMRMQQQQMQQQIQQIQMMQQMGSSGMGMGMGSSGGMMNNGNTMNNMNNMMMSPQQMQQQQQMQSQYGHSNSPRLKNMRPSKEMLNNMDPSKFSGVVVFEKGAPVEAHVDEPGQRPVWDELWTNFNTKHGV